MSGGTPVATKQQLAAISIRPHSVALSAGAGCGKTFVLSERFLKYLDVHPQTRKPDAELSDLVAFTYTDRAAREMRARIRKYCHDRLVKAADSDAEYWLDLVRQIDAARVSTIHAFCSAFLRAHFVEAGLDPQFVVLEAALAEGLKRECLDDILREQLAAMDDDTLELVRRYGLSGTRERIAEMLATRDKREMTTFLTVTPPELAARWETLRGDVCRSMLAELLEHPSAKDTLSLCGSLNFPTAKLDEQRRFLLQQLPRLPESMDPAMSIAELRAATMFGSFRSTKHWGDDPQGAEMYKAALKELREELDSVKKHLAWDGGVALEAAQLGLAVLRLALAVEQRYRAAKREQRALDFDDLLVETHSLLTAPDRAELRQQVCRRLKLLLVDESQDTNPLQVELIRALCGDDGIERGKLFFVGDFKQSIYRFLGADPRVFNELREKIPAGGRLPLSENFRSQPAIVNFVNVLFCDEFPEYEPLVARRSQVTSEPAVEFLWAHEPDVSRNGNTQFLLTREAQAIARRLAALLESAPQIVVERSAGGRETPRPIRPGDIAILFQSLTDVQAYEKALADLGLPYYLVGGKAFYSQQELFDLSNLLRVLEQPSDEVSLVGVLRSPFFSLTDETIFWLSQEKGGLSAGLFSDSLSPNIDDAQQEAVRFAARTLRTLRGQKDRLSITALINLALELTGFDAALVADFLGERKLANLRKLLEIARVYDQSGFASLADFVVQLSEFEASQPDEALAAVHAESSDVIRLMTIHQAKGLEFPVVVVADVDRPGRYPRAKAAFDPQWGPLVGLSNEPDRAEGPTGLALYLRQVDQAERQERTRLFYVATTRAADYLILSSSVTDFAAPAGPWAKLLAKRFDLESGRPLAGWPADCPHVAIAVTKNPEPPNGEKVEQSRADLTKLIESTDEPFAPDASRPRDIKPIEPDAAARRVFSFSRLTGRLKERRDWVEEKNEAQSEDGRTDAAALGKLIHAVLAETAWDGSRDIASLAARHAERLLIDQRPLIDEAIELVERFSRTELARKLGAASETHRELEFLLAWPPDTPRADTAPLFYGFIDCLYRDREGHWHLLDYKSNDVTAKRARTEARRYEPQLGLYALACEKVLNKPVASLTLHFLRPGVDVACQWDAAARQRTIETISAALAGEFSTNLS